MSSDTQQPPITIIGAGLTGCFMAILLAKRGYRVDIYERATEEEIIGNASRLSFNLLFRNYAMRMLRGVGLWNIIEPYTLNVRGFMTQVTPSSEPIFTPMDQEKNPYYIIKRSDLMRTLLAEAIHYPTVTVHFGTSLVDINIEAKTITIQNLESEKVETLPAAVVLGTDGVHSVVRKSMLHDSTMEREEYSNWTYKHFPLTPEWCEKLSLQKDVGHTWTREDAVVISHPNHDGSRAAIITLPQDKQKGFASLNSPIAIQKFITEQFPVLLPALPVITDALMHNPEGNFVTVRTASWHYNGFIALLGDAVHGMHPFSGQGVSAGLGDAAEIAKLIDAYGDNWNVIFPLYEKNRKPHMDALAELAQQRFSLYRRHTRADYSLVYEKFEGLLYKLFPKLVCPPLSEMIGEDPGKTADYIAAHKKLRKITQYLGAPLLVGLVTGAVAVHEIVTKRLKKK